MAPSTLSFIGLAALTLTACDLSQQKPQTIRTTLPPGVGSAQAIPAPLASEQPSRAAVQAPAHGPAAGGDNGAGERSIRLYGPGVSRKRQIRV